MMTTTNPNTAFKTTDSLIKTATKHPHNHIADTSARNTHTRSLWQRCLVAIALLVTCALGVKAEKYVIYYQEGDTKYYMANDGGTLTSTTTCVEATCVWVGESGGTFSNNGQSICFGAEYDKEKEVTLTGATKKLTIGDDQLVYYDGDYCNYYIYYKNEKFYATNLDTYYGKTRVKAEVAEATPPTPEPQFVDEAGVTAAKENIIVGVGYPKTTSAEYIALYELTANTKTQAEVDALVEAYMTSTDILLPENGKAYTFTNVMRDNARTKRYIKYENGKKVSVSANAKDATVFVCRKLSEGVYAFVAPDGNILTWVGNNETGAYKENGNINGYSSEYATEYNGRSDWNKITIKKNKEPANTEEFGHVRMVARRHSDGVSAFIVSNAENRFDQAGDNYFFNENYSSAWLIVEAHYPTTYEAVKEALAKIDKKEGFTPEPRFVASSDYLTFTLTCTENEGVIYYTEDGSDPTVATSNRKVLKAGQEGVVSFSATLGHTVKAYAHKEGYGPSAVVTQVMNVNTIDTADKLANITGNNIYVLTKDITITSHTPISDFTGIFNGCHHTISELNAPLFASADGAIIKNVVLDKVKITGGTGNVGAIAGTASGDTRIYNCGVLSGSIGGGTNTNVGSIAGLIEGTARVINCYSYANITGGTTVGGIVGYNSVASTSDNLKTLVMNCMYYGNITGDGDKAPIYNGKIISNAGDTGINNYNYYRHESPYSLNHKIDTYNCALAAEERYLTRFEFYRGILNSQRKLSAFYVTGSVGGFEEMGKWVLDKTIAPYPIIKPWGKYPSMINKVPTNRNTPYQGKVLGQLKVTIQGHGTVKLDITDMDTLNYDYNYYKVQLPYYNEYFDNNYTNGLVVTGWKIISIEGGTAGTFSTTGDNRYNFADRNCTDKDLYSKTNIVFAQGGYYNVPEGVTAITIEPYWGNAVYLSDATYDEVYTTNYRGSHFTPAGETPATYKEQNVYKSLGKALEQLPEATTVYDNAIVLVGNYHTVSEDWSNNQKRPFTIMSVDENGDNEPDYCIFHGHKTARVTINPVRFDFLWHPGLGMAHKVDGSGAKMPNQSIFRPLGWFEITETCLARYTEFEYDYANNNRTASPMILNNGIFEQFMSLYNDENTQNSSRTTYLRLGGNVYMEAFTPGTHTEYSHSTNHPPVTVCGGEYKEFYLSGVRPDAETVGSDALCYTNGGMFSLFASAYMEKINGDVVVKMDHSRVKEFYGGGINSIPSQISGDIKVTVNNSLIDFYCGGPKFGSMAAGKTVTTEATGTRFGKFYGAGYGGTSFYIANVLNTTLSSTSFNNGSYSGLYTSFEETKNGYATNYHLEHFSYAGGTATSIVSRFYRHYASLTFAQTNNVVSVLNNCIIDGDFYGGGNQGVVNGDITSTLIDCDIKGSAYGAGYSAAIPVCEVRSGLPTVFPKMNTNSGVFEKVALPAVEKYKWANDIYAVDHTAKLIPTKLDLKGLGTATGKIKIVIGGDSEIGGSVFGGGNASKVIGNTHVHIQGGTINGSVFGAGNQAEVTGKTEVVIGE